jgi:hypothetical protein
MLIYVNFRRSYDQQKPPRPYSPTTPYHALTTPKSVIQIPSNFNLVHTPPLKNINKPLSTTLNVECGRYHNVPCEQRLCKLCDMGEVEDECHFALFCKYYTNDRKILNEKLRLEFTTKLDCHDDLQSIMSCSDPKLLNVFSKYILTCFTKRNECLETGNNITRPNGPALHKYVYMSCYTSLN